MNPTRDPVSAVFLPSYGDPYKSKKLFSEFIREYFPGTQVVLTRTLADFQNALSELGAGTHLVVPATLVPRDQGRPQEFLADHITTTVIQASNRGKDILFLPNTGDLNIYKHMLGRVAQESERIRIIPARQLWLILGDQRSEIQQLVRNGVYLNNIA